jgi:GNAT superfamily N-acetyltransferase
MAELRPHLLAGEFVARVRRQQRDGGYQLGFLEDEDKIAQAAAGFRILENLPWGRFLYVDDLVTTGSSRSRGHGQALFDWLLARAREQNCAELHLDSGVQRFDAHRFYLRNRMAISAHHFELKLT